MRPFAGRALSAVALTACLAGTGSASPLNSRLLPMVPPGAEIVAGFENQRGSNSHGRLLLTTHNNRLDLDDWQALTGVDNKRVSDEVIEVAATPSGGPLSEHMLLVAGRFDRERIFRSIEQNGAGSVAFQGERILLIKPLTRERGDMLDTRWLAILDNRIGILGIPRLVQEALRRHADHAPADAILEERIRLLRPDVTSWNVLVGSRKTTKNFAFAQPHSAWAQLQQDADVLMVAVRFGSKIRIDFSIHADVDRGPDFFTRKAGFFTDALKTAPSPDAKRQQAQLQNFSLEPNRAKGSVELSSSQFEVWCDHLYRVRGSAPPYASSGN